MKGFSELTLSIVSVFLWLCAKVCSQPQQLQVPRFFIFGDSLVDNGNNNRILTLARANYRPYGIDFPQGATGRFTNGRTYVDALGTLHSVPFGKMIVLDLFAEVKPIWKNSSQFYGTPYVWCMLHNFGGNIEMYGTLDSISSSLVDARISENSTMSFEVLSNFKALRQEGTARKDYIGADPLSRSAAMEALHAYPGRSTLLLDLQLNIKEESDEFRLPTKEYKWLETRGVEEEKLVHNLPKDLKRDIKNYLCLDLLKRVTQLLGFPNYIPPYSRTRGPALLRGVNYASGAAGIRDETGTNLGDHTSMNQQVVNFASTVQDMRRLFRGDNNALNSHLSKCIFYSGMGRLFAPANSKLVILTCGGPVEDP
uniref:Alpha-N-acetylglucosaminidase tim-barrel domain-containing protein n=1 Tax=Fagus sylvatica TaxID=28930 RepID=A0A2N9FNM7_FAGSY